MSWFGIIIVLHLSSTILHISNIRQSILYGNELPGVAENVDKGCLTTPHIQWYLPT